MPRTADQAKRELARSMGDGWTYVADLISATAVWGAIGYGFDRLLGTWPILFSIGIFIGHGWGIWMIWMLMRKRQEEARQAARARGAER